jgi:hypothetical protein
MGEEGEDVAGNPPDLAGDVGRWGGRERGGFKLNPAPCKRARVRERRGKWATTWAQARERRGMSSEGVEDVGCRRLELGSNGWR